MVDSEIEEAEEVAEEVEALEVDEIQETAVAATVEKRLFSFLFEVVQEPILIMFGVVAGGAFGIHMAAFAIGFLQAIFLKDRAHLMARCTIEIMFAIQAIFVPSVMRCVALHRMGVTMSELFAVKQTTPYTCASLTICTIAIIVPSSNTITDS